jgi:3-methyl-2-oxobutanoate hydroxymethyltransferase
MPRISINQLHKMKAEGARITCLTAYDHPTALAADAEGLDVILVGDSLGMVVLGYESTLPVTLEDMIHHGKAVVRGASHALVVVDLPFMSYQESPLQALRSAGRLLKECGCQAVKLEGGLAMAPTVALLKQSGIAVMGHLGLTPQSVHALGGYRVQARAQAEAQRLLKDARALERAGAFAIVLEMLPAALAARVSRALKIPTIGIGAGPGCDGQVLVSHDLLGLTPGHIPRFARQYGQAHQAMRQAFAHYCADVRRGSFPGAKETPA